MGRIILYLIDVLLKAVIPDRKPPADVASEKTDGPQGKCMLAGWVCATHFLLLCFTMATTASPFTASHKAYKKYQSGEYDAVEKHLQEELIEKPFDPEINFNLGVVQHKLKDYAAAGNSFSRTVDAEMNASDELRNKAYFNWGNTLISKTFDALGPDWESKKVEDEVLDDAISHVESAIEKYTNALTVKKDDVKSWSDKENAEKLLEMLKQKKQQQEQQQDQQQDKNQDQKNDKDQQQDKKQDQQDQQNQQDQNKDSSSSKDNGDRQDNKDQQQQQKDNQQKKDQQKDEDRGQQEKDKQQAEQGEKDRSEQQGDQDQENKDQGEEQKDQDRKPEDKNGEQPENGSPNEPGMTEDEGEKEEDPGEEQDQSDGDQKEDGSPIEPEMTADESGMAAGAETDQQSQDSVKVKGMKVVLDKLEEDESKLQKRRIYMRSKGQQPDTRRGQNPW